MDGLEAVEILYSKVKQETTSFRVDSSYFNMRCIKLDETIKSAPHFYIPTDKIVSGPFGSSLKSESYLYNGDIPFVRIENIKNQFFINKNNLIYINNADNMRISNSQLFEGDLIMSKVGNTIGIFAYVDKTLKTCNISENNIGIKLHDYGTEKKIYICTYFNCKYARQLIIRRISGNAQPKLNVDDIGYIPIPEFSVTFYSAIAATVEDAQSNLQSADLQYKQAEEMLSKYLQIEPADGVIATKKLSESFLSSGRLDAEYYQPKYEHYYELLGKYELTYIPKEFYVYKNTGTDYSEESQDVGVIKTKQLTPKGINLDNIESYFNKETCITNNSVYVKNGDVIFASMGVGSLGKASIFSYDGDKQFVTDSTLRIYRQKENSQILPEFLCVYLQSKIGQELIYRYVVGSTGIINIYDDDIAKIPIPIVDKSVQHKIAELVQESFALRRKSKQMLDNAVKAVEMAIETDENTAIAWLDAQGEN